MVVDGAKTTKSSRSSSAARLRELSLRFVRQNSARNISNLILAGTEMKARGFRSIPTAYSSSHTMTISLKRLRLTQSRGFAVPDEGLTQHSKGNRRGQT